MQEKMFSSESQMSPQGKCLNNYVPPVGRRSAGGLPGSPLEQWKKVCLQGYFPSMPTWCYNYQTNPTSSSSSMYWYWFMLYTVYSRVRTHISGVLYSGGHIRVPCFSLWQNSSSMFSPGYGDAPIDHKHCYMWPFTERDDWFTKNIQTLFI